MMRSGFLLVCILGLASVAQADFAVLASSNVSVTDAFEGNFLDSQTSTTDHFPDAAMPMSAASSLAIGAFEAADGDATTTFARLHAHSSASAGGVGGVATGEGESRVNDTLYVESSTLANGTPVSLSVEFDLAVDFSPPAVFDSPIDGSVHASFFASPTRTGGGLHLDYLYDASGPAFTGRPLLSGTMAAQVGDLIPLDYYTRTHALVSRSQEEQPGASTSATLNGSVGITVDEATPDVTLIADSGYDYTQTVPEPSAAASLGAALIGLLGVGVVRVGRRRV